VGFRLTLVKSNAPSDVVTAITLLTELTFDTGGLDVVVHRPTGGDEAAR
jgi:hypothetical protein